MKKIFLSITSLLLTACNAPEKPAPPADSLKEDIIEAQEQVQKQEEPQIHEEEALIQKQKAEYENAKKNHARDMHFLRKELETKVESGEIEWEEMRKALWDKEKDFRNGMTKKLEASRKAAEETSPQE